MLLWQSAFSLHPSPCHCRFDFDLAVIHLSVILTVGEAVPSTLSAHTHTHRFALCTELTGTQGQTCSKSRVKSESLL